ncbi:MAG: type II toxin-antitoxin system HicA family toxin [Thermodesulfovibrionales bacterium]
MRLLQEKGWHLDRIEGSHHILIKDNKTLSVPVHGSKDLGKGLLHALMRQGGLK